MRWRFLILCLLVPCVAGAGAESFDYTSFERIAVLQDGRIKPLGSLARVMLPRVCGRTSWGEKTASEWLAFMFFSPQAAMQARMMTIASPQAARMLGLGPHDDHLYSFEEVAAILPLRAEYINGLTQKNKGALTADESEVLRIYGAANDFAELIGTFSLLLPMSGVDTAALPQGVKPGAGISYFGLLKDRQALENNLEQLVKRKGPVSDAYTQEERTLSRLVARLSLQEQLDADNALVRVIPPAWGAQEWLSPWGVLKSSSGSPASAALLKDWRTLADSYRAGDTHAWSEISQQLLAASLSALTPFEGARLMLEWYYHRLNLLPLAACCYGLGLLLMAAGGRFAHLAPMALLGGLILHAVALCLRMLILLRPPVSTLYESLIFVSFVVMAASARLGWRGANRAALLAGALTGFMLLMISWVFAGSGDTLGVLVAVLNTNFWLATHVVCITTGYACALVAGAIAHLYLFRRAVERVSETMLSGLATLLHRTALIALLFTATGTMLGGIWADQSWGRFWGWDPKENGALLIVLWLIWALHGRIAGQLGAIRFAVVMALVNIVVGCAWIGVNLLGVGLHSYGFTDVAALGLLAFCALEIAYVAAMLLALKWRAQVLLPS